MINDMIQDVSITHKLIPGGAHTNSKGDDQFPLNAPRYLERGDGCYVWDEKDNQYLDWTMGLRSVSLGYNLSEINKRVIEQLIKGSNFGRPSYIETELALKLSELIPSAEMVKFAKNGSSATTAAVKLARAYTGRDYVALCKEQPFFSYDDWFICTTPCNRGIPAATSELSLTFHYNDIESLKKLIKSYSNKIACVILEPATIEHPRPNFLKEVKELCQENGIVLIFDEMITGFRWHIKGAQTYYNVVPDLSTFGKGIANGISLAALVGKKEIMELGGLHHNQKRVFLLSSTHGAENHSLSAALATINFFQDKNVISHMWTIGGMLIKLLQNLIKELSLENNLHVGGIHCSPYYIFKDSQGNVSNELRTIFLQEMIKQGIIFNYIAPSFSHTIKEVELTVLAAEKALKVCKKAIDTGFSNYLEGPTVKPVFRMYN